MSVYDKIPFIQESGNPTGHEVTVYALSTCGFCKRAIAYLKEKNVAFRYVYVDTLPQDLRQELKTALRDTFQRSLLYPYLVVDGNQVVTGFVKEKWDELIGITP
ncbi:MAG: glutaredoxin family protein [Spirochaetes bacterium]|nr:glutaredoxin family protein [Spirochaetota bacterium]